MCDCGPLVYKKELTCCICQGNNGAKLDDTDEEAYCHDCAVDLFGAETVDGMEE